MTGWMNTFKQWFGGESPSVYTLIPPGAPERPRSPQPVGTGINGQQRRTGIDVGLRNAQLWRPQENGRRQGAPILVREYPLAQRTGERYIHRRPRPLRRVQVVLPKEEAYWELRGWHRQGDRWYGRYQVDGRSWEGFAEKNGRYWDLYILNQPYQLNSDHCFWRKGRDGQGRTIHFVHFSPKKPVTLSQGIGGVEVHIGLALRQNGGR